MALDFATMEAALWDWVRASLSADVVPDGSIIWADQNHEQPPNPVVTLRLSGPLTPLGAVAGYVQTYEPAERRVRLHIQRGTELTLTVQAYTDDTHGQLSGFALLTDVQHGLSHPDIRAGLRAGGLFPFDDGSVMNLSALEVTDFEGRASLAVRFYVTHDSVAYAPAVETVTGTQTVNGHTQPYSVSSTTPEE